MTFDISKIAFYLSNPGIYLMKDSDGKIIYIGKAKNLKESRKILFSKKSKLQDSKTS